MTEDNFNWSTFTHAIRINAGIDEVYAMLSTAHGLERWFQGTAQCTDVEGQERGPHQPMLTGDKFHWNWLAKDYTLYGQIIKSEAGKSVTFTFGPMFEVRWQVVKDGHKCRVELSQWYAKGQEENKFRYLNCAVCWVFFLTNLKSVLEHSHDLRETETADQMLVNF